MIDKIEDLEFDKIDGDGDAVQKLIETKLGISFSDIYQLLSKDLQDEADKIVKEFILIAPYGEWGKSIEDPVQMKKFFTEEAAQPTHWQLSQISAIEDDPKQPKMLGLVFANTVVDEGDAIKGYVYISFAGAIRHHFVQGEP